MDECKPFDAEQRGRRARIAAVIAVIGATAALRAALYLADLVDEADDQFAGERSRRRAAERECFQARFQHDREHHPDQLGCDYP